MIRFPPPIKPSSVFPTQGCYMHMYIHTYIYTLLPTYLGMYLPIPEQSQGGQQQAGVERKLCMWGGGDRGGGYSYMVFCMNSGQRSSGMRL